MFVRPEQNYAIEDTVIDGILSDPAQPLCRISKLLPDGATVLDIGSGSGVLGRVLRRAGKNVTIDGIEPNAFAAELAKPFYRTINVGYAQDHFKAIRSVIYDYVVLADVIEHIPDPAVFLSELLRVLPASTKLLISIPNISFGGVRLSLLNGVFDYVDSGLLERTHLRFFTLMTARRLFDVLNLSVERIFSLERSFYRVEFPRGQLRASPFQILRLATNAEARAYQYLFVLARGESREVAAEHCGASAVSILMDALVAWPIVMRAVRRWSRK
jgi:2-polyprenyl-3-methyl-5-hydroxy-6-metoxy-1,4-benzoquinol methylase